MAAVALGAKIVERHVTLDKTWKGSDHAASLEPAELTELVRSIRLVERAVGSGIKQMLPCEKPCHDKVRLWCLISKHISYHSTHTTVANSYFEGECNS